MNNELDRRRLEGRAEVIAAMDCLVRHFNDEEAVVPWLTDGVPDDMPHGLWGLPNEERRQKYIDFVSDMDDEEYEDMVRLFARLVRGECFKTTFQKGAFY